MTSEDCPHLSQTPQTLGQVTPPTLWRRIWDWLMGRDIIHVDSPDTDTEQAGPTSGASESAARFVEVGWLVDTQSAEFIWDAPRPLARRLGKSAPPKVLQKCPAVLDLEKRFYVVPAPFDLHLGLQRGEKGEWVMVNKAGRDSTIYANKVRNLAVLTSPDQWRYRDKPLLQISAPYRFISDEPVWMYQLPPFLHYGANAWPGLVISGRLPTHIWPRIMMWAFEWHDTDRDLIIHRGEPWFFAHFEAMNPTRPIRLVHAQMTPELRQFCKGTDSVTNYVNQTYSLFDIAEARRPQKLLVPFESATFDTSDP